MLSKEENSRYSKQTILTEFGTEGQEKLCAAKVLVVGVGGLGCPVLQYITAAGVGHIGIADSDNVDISNLQRQILYTADEIGQSKVAVAKRKLNALNPHVTITTYPTYIDSSNVLDLIRDYDIIVDGSDNFDTRYLLNDACVMMDKPLVSGAIYKFEGQVSVFNYRNGPTYRCIFPEPPLPEQSPNCSEIGVIATLPGIVGTMQANEVIKIITGIGEVLSGRLIMIDTLNMSTRMFSFNLIASNRNITRLSNVAATCVVDIKTMNYEELKRKMEQDNEIQVVDVREIEEHYIGNIGGVNIPLSKFGANCHVLNPEITTVLYCGVGTRSLHAAKMLQGKGFKHIFNLENGINHLGVI